MKKKKLQEVLILISLSRQPTEGELKLLKEALPKAEIEITEVWTRETKV